MLSFDRNYINTTRGTTNTLMGEEYVTHVILAELFPTSRTLAVSIPKVFIDALLAEEMKAAGDGHTLEAVLANRATQHTETHLQHIQIVLVVVAVTGRRRRGIGIAALFTLSTTLFFLYSFELGKLPLQFHPSNETILIC